MQTRDMVRPNSWKLLASVAAMSAAGIGGLALADSHRAENPPPITLSDPQALSTAPQTPIANDLGFGDLGLGPLSDFDSPFDINDTGDGEPSITGDTPQGLDTLTGDTADSDELPAAPVEIDDETNEEGQEDPSAEAASSAEELESPDIADGSPAG